MYFCLFFLKTPMKLKKGPGGSKAFHLRSAMGNPDTSARPNNFQVFTRRYNVFIVLIFTLFVDNRLNVIFYISESKQKSAKKLPPVRIELGISCVLVSLGYQ